MAALAEYLRDWGKALRPTARVIPLKRITAYNAVPAQTDGSPGIASCGPNKPHQIALSQDLFFKAGHKLCGAKIKIVLSDGKIITGRVWDTMNPMYRRAADILMASVGHALKFGVRHGYAEIRFYSNQKGNL